MSIPDFIKETTTKIRHAVIGGEITNTIADGIEKIAGVAQDSTDTTKDIEEYIKAVELEWDSDPNKDPEVLEARGGQPRLKDRFENTDRQLAHIAHDVTQYITDNDHTGVIATINKAKDGDTIFFPSRETSYDIGLIETNKKLTFESNGIINGIIKPLKDTHFLGLTFENVSKAIDLSEMNGSLSVENCFFENVDYPIEGVGQELGVMESVKLIGNVFNNSVSPVQIRNKRINDLTVENNVVKNVTTSTRFAVAFRFGTDNDTGQTIDDWYIKNVSITGNSFHNILNTGTGSDWEAGGVQVFAENIIVKDNHFNNIERTGNADCEAVYSKGYNILVENNIFNNAGGNEGTVVLKRNGLEESGTSRIQNNLFIKKEKNMNTYNEIGVLLSMSNVVVTNNSFINYNHGVETYGLGAEGLTFKNNELINLDSAVFNRVTDVRILEDDLVISNNVLRQTKNIVLTSPIFETNASVVIENNLIKNCEDIVFTLKGTIKKIVINGNKITTVDGYSSNIIETNISHPLGIDLLINGNFINDINGRVLVSLNTNATYNHVEINNNSVGKAERGFSITGTVDFMVAMNNNLVNVTSHQLSATPDVYYRINNYPLEDIVPE